MPRLVPGIHVLRELGKAWVAGSSPAMTKLAHQFRSSGSTGSGETSMPSSISDFASSGEASP